MNPKITEHHRSKPAYIYLRQSTPGQVRHHRESTERQYALREKALELGWTEPTIRILDRDLGVSGARQRGGKTSRPWWRRFRWVRWARCLRWRSRDWRARM